MFSMAFMKAMPIYISCWLNFKYSQVQEKKRVVFLQTLNITANNFLRCENGEVFTHDK